MRICFFKNASLNKKFCLIVLFGSFSCFITFGFFKKQNEKITPKFFHFDLVECFRYSRDISNHSNFKYEKLKPNLNKKVLLVSNKLKKSFSKQIILVLDSLKLKYRVSDSVSHLIKFYNTESDIYSVIIFEKLSTYSKLNHIDSNILKRYCNKFNIGIIAFHQNSQDQYILNKQGLAVTKKKVQGNYNINSRSPILRITKPGSLTSASYITSHFNSEWNFFHSNDSNYEPVTYVVSSQCSPPLPHCQSSPIIRDKGLIDGVDKIIFGTDFKFWLHLMLFLDALFFQARGGLHMPLERYVMVDIDDVFVGKTSTRITKPDVQAMLESQERISRVVHNFTFNLGFSGKYFLHGNDAEDEGDLALLAAKKHFWWFGHSWSHSQAHHMPLQKLLDDMLLNKQFAKTHNLPAGEQHYAVAPHHAGVYPVHEELYAAWRRVWDVRVTSTEEYPALWPASGRRGFVHQGIKVLPRQVCGLYTHTIFLERFPGGPAKLMNSILGGELFLTVLFNQMSIFMTHQSNYANDRLALLAFENVFSFLKCWTNLALQTLPPAQLAQLYFDTYPQERLPLWKNPCESSRHRQIWSPSKRCDAFPSVVVIGPQKTGTTALHTYLGLHAGLKASVANNGSFEEVQFFIDKNYFKGIDWYMRQFPSTPSKPLNITHSTDDDDDPAMDGRMEEVLSEDVLSVQEEEEEKEEEEKVMFFEKSANYFADENAPRRMYHLLPRAKIIALLINPSSRAYSWYQHMLAHGDPIARNYSFHQVVTFTPPSPPSSSSSSTSSSSTSSSSILDLQRKCLSDGLYSVHIGKWLKYYSPEQLLLLDGERMKKDPVRGMEQVQTFLSLRPKVDYSELIKYSRKKGYYCVVRKGRKLRCLGGGKGRSYPAMEDRTREYLSRHYRKANAVLKQLLLRLDYPVFPWLKTELKYAASLPSHQT